MSSKLKWASALASLCAAWDADARCVSAPELVVGEQTPQIESAMGDVRSDRAGRVVAPISVNGEGPFRFVVDTGANRSVLSRTLAERLGLASHGSGEIHSVYGAFEAPLLRDVALDYQGLTLGEKGVVPVLQGPVLAGEMGLIGADGMSGRRLLMDFERDCIEIVPSAQASPLHGWITLPGVLRFGHLMMIRGSIRGVAVNVLIDTGSDTSLANPALLAALSTRIRAPSSDSEAVRFYTAGQPVSLESEILLPFLQLGGVDIKDVAAFVGDFHIFRLWELNDQPTLLLGMDVLSSMRAMAIDYERSRVYVRLRRASPSMHVG